MDAASRPAHLTDERHTNVVTRAPRRAAKTSALLLELYGGFVRRLGGWMAVAHIVQLLAELGVDEPTARAAAVRLVRSGLLRRHAKGRGSVGYALTDEGRAILSEGDRRIFQRRSPTDLRDGWVVVIFSIPEPRRDLRHVFRSRLVRLGFGNTAPGVWIAPRWLLDDLRHAIERLHVGSFVQIYVADYRGDASLHDLIATAWDLAALRALYVEFIVQRSALVERFSNGHPIDPAEAFVEYMQAQAQWRQLPFLDPGLPPEFLPSGWEGDRAADLFFRLRDVLDPPAMEHVRAITGG
jgi:phenylacetic acid degradation operon negative regulatory protein